MNRSLQAGYVLLRALLLCGFMCAALVQPALAAQKQVLLLLNASGGVEAELLTESLTAQLKSVADGVDLFTEVLDTNRFSGSDQEAYFARFLREKYARQSLDLVIAAGPDSLAFVLQRRASLFPGLPVVFAGIRASNPLIQDLPADTTGISSHFDVTETLDLAMKLQPDARQVVVISGKAAVDRRWEEFAREHLRGHASRVQITWLSGQPLANVLTTVSGLPRNTIVIYLTMIEDGAGTHFIPNRNVVSDIAAAAGAPVYGVYEAYVGHGVVGGYVDDMRVVGDATGDLVKRVLRGEKAADIPVRAASPVHMVDWRQLQRWKLDPALLPRGTVLRFREGSLWNQYGWLIVTGAMLLLAQALIISSMLVQGARRRRAENALRESEQRFRRMADSAPVMIWMSGKDSNFSFLNRGWLDFAGSQTAFSFGDARSPFVHPDDAPACLRAYQHAIEQKEGFLLECRLRRHDGVYRWMLTTGVPRLSKAGVFLGFIGSCTDISERRDAEIEKRLHLAELAHLNRVATMGEYAASVAHELTQPLSAILVNADAAAMTLEKESPSLDLLREILADIRSDDRRAVEIIHGMRRFLQRHEITPQPLNLNALVSEVIHLVVIEASARHIALRFEPATDIGEVAGDRVHLRQVLMNLVLNAMDAVEPVEGERSITVTVMAAPARMAQVTVSDTGTGIREGELEVIFRPFVTTKLNGVGMGLSIIRTIVAAHQGRVWAENRLPRGASFHFTLPLAATDSPASVSRA